MMLFLAIRTCLFLQLPYSAIASSFVRTSVVRNIKQHASAYEVRTLMADMLNRLKVDKTIHDLYWDIKMAAELVVDEKTLTVDNENFMAEENPTAAEGREIDS